MLNFSQHLRKRLRLRLRYRVLQDGNASVHVHGISNEALGVFL